MDYNYPYSLELVTAPEEEPVNVTEARDWLRMHEDITDDDDLIQQLIKTAREISENITNRALITQTWKVYFERFPYPAIRMPKPPLASVTHVKYYDTNGTLQTLAVTTDYVVNAKATPGVIVPAYGKYWPSTRGVPNAVEIQFVTGYGLPAAVPHTIKAAIKTLVGHLYEHRESVLIGLSATEVPQSAQWLLYPYRIIPV